MSQRNKGTSDPVQPRYVFAGLKVLCVALCLVLANLWIQSLVGDLDVGLNNDGGLSKTVYVMACVYAVTLALPFVPGAEIGLVLIALMGTQVLVLVYLSTVSGLLIAFTVGRFTPVRVLVGFARDLGLQRLATVLRDFDAMTLVERQAYLSGQVQGRAAHFVLQHRYIALALLINTPGNTLLGGGGGLALLAGLSRLFSPWRFGVMVLIAVSPIPLTVLFLGSVLSLPS